MPPRGAHRGPAHRGRAHRGLALLACVGLAGCGAAPVRDEDVFHEPALRPGVVPPASEAERELLSRLASLEPDREVRIGDHVFVPRARYAAASGRACMRIEVAGDGARVACEDDGAWVFVPDVFGGDDPFRETTGSP